MSTNVVIFRAFRLNIEYIGVKDSLQNYLEPICATDTEDASKQVEVITANFAKGPILTLTLKEV